MSSNPYGTFKATTAAPTTTTTTTTTATTTTTNLAGNNNIINGDDPDYFSSLNGCLRMTILSAYDLPDREPPMYIRLEIGSIAPAVHTGPPVQRHKDRNSFKFHSSHNKFLGNNNINNTTTNTTNNSIAANNNGELMVEMPTLAELYRETAILTVVYANPSKTQFTASYPLHQLLIHETTWLVLNLTPVGGPKQPPQEQEQPNETRTNATKDSIPLVVVASSAAPTATASSNSSSGGSVYEDEEVPPTLRLQMTLHGPYRTEVAAFLRLLRAWLTLVDHLERKWNELIPPLTNHARWLLIAMVPLVAIAVVTTPIWLGVLLVTLPLVLPAFLTAFCAGLVLTIALVFLYASTKVGRQQVASLLSPIHHALLHTPLGQSWIYQTGPRPTPVRLCRLVFPTSLAGKLLVSLWIDFMGSATYLLPLLGEVMDVIWAPLQTIFIMALYCPEQENGTSSSTLLSNILPYLSFFEEFLPLTDIVPSATLGWLGEFALPALWSIFVSSKSTTTTRTVVMEERSLLSLNHDSRNMATTTTTTAFNK